MDAVSQLLREAAETTVLPVFGRREAEPEEKAPGEWVTVADRAAEDFLTPRLADLLPGSVVVGEEAAAADPSILNQLGFAGHVWLLDPLDGTANFAAGRSPFALMAALVSDGETTASWILDPLTGQLSRAQRGAGAWLGDRRMTTDPAPPPAEEPATKEPATQDLATKAPATQDLKGAVLRRFLPAGFAAHVAAAESQFAELSAGSGCAGADYPAITTGARDFILYWRTLPWDHAPGVLFVREAGGKAQRLDGAPYLPGQHSRPGLLVARNSAIWAQAHAALVP